MSAAAPRQLFRHGSVYALTSVVTAALSFAILPVYAHALGTEGTGLVEVLAISGELLTFVVAQGMSGAWFRLRFDHQGEARRSFESTVLWYLLGSAGALLLALHFVGPPVARWLTPATPYYPLWFLTALGACAGIFSELYLVRLQADQLSTGYALFSVLRRGLVLGVVVFFVVHLQAGVTGKVEGETLALVAAGLASWILLRPQAPTRASRSMLDSVLSYSLPLLPHAIAMQVITVADRFVLSQVLGLGAVGVYAMGYRVARVMETINGGLSVAYRTMFTEHTKRNEGRESPADLAELARLGVWMVAASALMCSAIAAVVHDVLLLLLPKGGEFADSARVVPILCAGLVAHACYLVLVQPVVYATDKIGRMPLISGAGAVVDVAACLLLIPLVGLMGAAWARLVAYTAMAVCAYFAGRNVLPQRHRFVQWWILITITAVALVAYHIVDIRVATWPARLAIKLGVFGVSALFSWRVVSTTPRGSRTEEPA